jgi:hypothetical protein
VDFGFLGLLLDTQPVLCKSGDVGFGAFEGSPFFAFKSKSDWNLFSVTRYLLANEDIWPWVTHASKNT